MKKSDLKIGEAYAVTNGSARYEREDYDSAFKCEVMKFGVERKYTTHEGMATFHNKRNDGILVKVLEDSKPRWGGQRVAGEELVVTGRDIWMLWSELEENKARRAREDKLASQKQDEADAHEVDLAERVAKVIGATDTVTVSLAKSRRTENLTGRVSLPTNAFEELLKLAETAGRM